MSKFSLHIEYFGAFSFQSLVATKLTADSLQPRYCNLILNSYLYSINYCIITNLQTELIAWIKPSPTTTL